MKTQRIALVFGGISTEHEVSIQSAARIAEGLAMIKHLRTIPIFIERDGRWRWSREGLNLSRREIVLAAADDAMRSRFYQPAPLEFAQALLHLTADEISTVFIMLHGEGGEDGRLQGALELAGIPYTGSGPAASALAMDKPHTQACFRASGLPIADFIALDRDADRSQREAALKQLGVPVVVKPSCGGSSVGVKIAMTESEARAALDAAFEYGQGVLLERWIDGIEFTCGVLGEGAAARALPVTQILPPEGRFFDYDAKYSAGVSRELTPAPIDEARTRHIQELAVRAHRIIGCEGFSRTDFIARGDELFVLEINTVPGMTATSLVPQALEAAGIAFTDFLEGVLAHARARGKISHSDACEV